MGEQIPDKTRIQKMIDLRNNVIRSARRLNGCMAEFDGDLQPCGDCLINLLDAVCSLEDYEHELMYDPVDNQ